MKSPEETQGAAPLIDEAKAEQFAQKMMQSINGAALVLMSSIGHKTRLFDTMAEMPPATAADIAQAASLNERYVREWLATMVMSEVVEYDEYAERYALPAEHAAFLTRKASPNNLAVASQFLPVLATAEASIVDRFSKGGGLGYEEYPHFHCVMAEDSAQTTVGALFEHILPLIDGIGDRLEAGIRVIDIGCGAGRAILTLAKRYPKSAFTGLDLCEAALDIARTEAAEQGIRNVTFVASDAMTYQPGERFQLVTTFDAVHDQRDPLGLIHHIHALLSEDGVYLMQDIGGSASLMNNRSHPLAPFLYTISCMHCMPVSLGQGGPGLGTMWGEETAQAFLEQAGFSHISSQRLAHDILNVYFVAKK
jgi:ubiquinone/menaquinone biosynthesis C-methylase UbiE